MLLDIAIADAYGAGFEFATPEVLARRSNDFTRYFQRNIDEHSCGVYTNVHRTSRMVAPHSTLKNGEYESKRDRHLFLQCFWTGPSTGVFTKNVQRPQ